MKKIITIILLMISSSNFAQKVTIDPEVLKATWSLVSLAVLPKINDTLTQEIIANTIPKFIDQDVKGAVLEITDAIYRVKKIKVLNKDFLSLMDKNINAGIEAVKQQDYATAMNVLSKSVLVTNAYIKKGILDKPESQSLISSTSLDTTYSEIVTSTEVNEIIVKANESKNSTAKSTVGTSAKTTTTPVTTTSKLPCETNKMAKLTIVNKSDNPYLIYKNGNYLMTISGKSVKKDIYVALGTTLFKAEQQSGYLMYATVNNRVVKFTAACQEQTINIGFQD